MYTILDNDGETFDRYTIVDHKTGAIWGASCRPYAPNGFGQFCGHIPVRKGETIKDAVARYLSDVGHLGHEVAAADVPADVKRYAEQVCNVPEILTF